MRRKESRLLHSNGLTNHEDAPDRKSRQVISTPLAAEKSSKMDIEMFWFLKLTFGGLAALFTLLGAILTFGDSLQNEETESTRAWFRQKWETVNNSTWLVLPEKVTRWLFDTRLFLLNRMEEMPSWLGDALLVLLPIALFTGCWYYFSLPIACAALVIGCPVLFFLVIKYNEFVIISDFAGNVLTFLTLCTGIITATVWLLIILKQDILQASVIIVILFPIYWYSLVLPIMFLHEWLSTCFKREVLSESTLLLFLFGVTSGLTMTLLAFLMGHILMPQSYVPQNLQMLFQISSSME